MAEKNVGSENQSTSSRPDVYARVSQAFQVEDRDWNTVNRRVATRVLAGTGAAFALLASGVAGFRAIYASKIYPNVRIGDVNVGGMSREEAIAAVQARVNQLNISSVSYSYQSHTWEPTLAEIGVSVDIPALVDEALALGRDDTATNRLVSTSELLQKTKVVPLRFGMQLSSLNGWLDQVDTDIDDPAIDATFTASGAELIITDDSTGTAADRKAITAQINETLATLAPIKAKLPTAVAEPRITKADLKANESAVLNILSNSVTVRFEDQKWEVQPEEVSQFMAFNSSVSTGTLETSVDFDRTALGKYLNEQFAESVNRVPINSQVQFYNGQLSATTSSQDGKTMKVTEFANLVAESFLSDHERVDIPVVTTKADVREDNLDTLGINEKLARADSNFGNSSDARATNILTGIRLINNSIIAPGDEFSFNGAVGPIDGNPEFVGGQGIVAGVIQDEFGGGICQVVTTTFRAAILAGLPITEWHAHTYRLSGYELDGWGPGFDASILQPDYEPDPSKWADLRFQNNTENFILLSSWADGGYHIVELYGTNDGRNIQISDTSIWDGVPSDDNAWNVDYNAAPGTNYISAYPLTGSGASFTRTVTDVPNEEDYERTFTSEYASRGFQCTCSPDMDGSPCW